MNFKRARLFRLIAGVLLLILVIACTLIISNLVYDYRRYRFCMNDNSLVRDWSPEDSIYSYTDSSGQKVYIYETGICVVASEADDMVVFYDAGLRHFRQYNNKILSFISVEKLEASSRKYKTYKIRSVSDCKDLSEFIKNNGLSGKERLTAIPSESGITFYE